MFCCNVSVTCVFELVGSSCLLAHREGKRDADTQDKHVDMLGSGICKFPIHE